MENNKETIAKNIQEKNITVGVIGLGYVGLPLATEFAKRGIKTIGFEIDREKVVSLNNKVNYIQDVDSNNV
ncbi:MAG TPA: NAD(P)-binding domain-containing protein, partial [Candidatus Kapabacteria bacterium]|nr:NAD(P)-binding domain-containing protein [Candidatus Kapabacteria bacterium]